MDNAAFDIDICRQCQHKDCRYCRFNPDNRPSDAVAVMNENPMRHYAENGSYVAEARFTLCSGITSSYRDGLYRDTI